MSESPPIDQWARDEVLRELARLASDLPHVDFDEAWRRLQRLTLDQRAELAEALGRMGLEQWEGPGR